MALTQAERDELEFLELEREREMEMRGTAQPETPAEAPPEMGFQEKMQRALPMALGAMFPQVSTAVQAAKDLPESLEATRLGVAESVLGTALGAKELMGLESDTDAQALAMLREDVEAAGPYATGGQIAGELAQLAIPGAAIARGAKAAPKVLQKALPVVGDIGLAAGQAAIRAPTKDETRAGQATEAATAALGGTAAGKLLQKSLQGVGVTDAARKLLDKGVPLTPGQASEAGLARGFDVASSITPFMAKGIRQMKEEGVEAWNREIFNEVAPLGKSVTEAGEKGAKQLANFFNEGYTNAWAKAGRPSNEGLVSMIDTGTQGMRRLSDDSQRMIGGVFEDVRDMTRAYTPEKVKELDKSLRKKISQAEREQKFDLLNTLRGMRQSLRDSLGPEARNDLLALDSKYDKYLTVKRAATQPQAMEKGFFSPQDLAKASKTVGGETRAFTREGPLLPQALEGVETVGKKDPVPFLNIVKGLAQVAPSPVGFQRGLGQTLLGETQTQKQLRETVDPLVEALRQYGVSGGTIGAAIE